MPFTCAETEVGTRGRGVKNAQARAQAAAAEALGSAGASGAGAAEAPAAASEANPLHIFNKAALIAASGAHTAGEALEGIVAHTKKALQSSHEHVHSDAIAAAASAAGMLAVSDEELPLDHAMNVMNAAVSTHFEQKPAASPAAASGAKLSLRDRVRARSGQ